MRVSAAFAHVTILPCCKDISNHPTTLKDLDTPQVNAGREWHYFRRAAVPWQNDTSLRQVKFSLLLQPLKVADVPALTLTFRAQDFKMLRKRNDWDPKQHYKSLGWERKGTNVKSKEKVVWPKLYQMGEVVLDEKNPAENLPKALRGKSLTEQLLADDVVRENLQKKFRKRQEISGGWHIAKSKGGKGREGQKKRRIPPAPKDGGDSIKQMMDEKVANRASNAIPFLHVHVCIRTCMSSQRMA